MKQLEDRLRALRMSLEALFVGRQAHMFGRTERLIFLLALNDRDAPAGLQDPADFIEKGFFNPPSFHLLVWTAGASITETRFLFILYHFGRRDHFSHGPNVAYPFLFNHFQITLLLLKNTPYIVFFFS